MVELNGIRNRLCTCPTRLHIESQTASISDLQLERTLDSEYRAVFVLPKTATIALYRFGINDDLRCSRLAEPFEAEVPSVQPTR